MVIKIWLTWTPALLLTVLVNVDQLEPVVESVANNVLPVRGLRFSVCSRKASFSGTREIESYKANDY
jgi:hypothetical protein